MPSNGTEQIFKRGVIVTRGGTKRDKAKAKASRQARKKNR